MVRTKKRTEKKRREKMRAYSKDEEGERKKVVIKRGER